jgi:hypothetical protein
MIISIIFWIFTGYLVLIIVTDYIVDATNYYASSLICLLVHLYFVYYVFHVIIFVLYCLSAAIVIAMLSFNEWYRLHKTYTYEDEKDAEEKTVI